MNGGQQQQQQQQSNVAAAGPSGLGATMNRMVRNTTAPSGNSNSDCEMPKMASSAFVQQRSMAVKSKNPGLLMAPFNSKADRKSLHSANSQSILLNEKNTIRSKLAQDPSAVHVGLGTEVQANFRSSGKITGFTPIDLPVSEG